MRVIYTIKLERISDIKDFVNIVSAYTDNIYLQSGMYVVDAKSILGIMSLDLSKELVLTSDSTNECFFEDITKKLKDNHYIK